MARLRFPQRVVLVLFFTVVLAAPAIASQPRQRAGDRQTGFVTALISDLHVHVWSLLGLFWAKNGCIADPHGTCKAAGTWDATTQMKEGCVIDPHGACKAADTWDAAAPTDNGCGLDPHGSCGH
jgi:hypothetical protein